MKERGFTLIEILIVVAIIAILSTVILVSLDNSRKNSRVKSALSVGRSALPVIIACNDSGATVNSPSPAENGTRLVCDSGFSSAFWSALPSGYTYAGGTYSNSNTCSFQISTNGDSTGSIVCNCSSLNCQ